MSDNEYEHTCYKHFYLRINALNALVSYSIYARCLLIGPGLKFNRICWTNRCRPKILCHWISTVCLKSDNFS